MCVQVSDLVKDQTWSLPLLGTHQCIQGDACCCLDATRLRDTQPVIVHCSAQLCFFCCSMMSTDLAIPPLLHSITIMALWHQQRLQVTALLPVMQLPSLCSALHTPVRHSSCCCAQAINYNNSMPAVTQPTHKSCMPAQVDGRFRGCKLGPSHHLQRQQNPVRMSSVCPP